MPRTRASVRRHPRGSETHGIPAQRDIAPGDTLCHALRNLGRPALKQDAAGDARARREAPVYGRGPVGFIGILVVSG